MTNGQELYEAKKKEVFEHLKVFIAMYQRMETRRLVGGIIAIVLIDCVTAALIAGGSFAGVIDLSPAEALVQGILVLIVEAMIVSLVMIYVLQPDFRRDHILERLFDIHPHLLSWQVEIDAYVSNYLQKRLF